MNPNKIGIDDIKIPRVLAICHKGTQTNDDSPNSSIHSSKSRGTSPGKTPSGRTPSGEGSVKVFEFSQIVQDADHPESITIVKDSFSEETRGHSSSNTSQDATSNRYKYCREVIKPFLRDYPSDCQASDDEIIKDVIASVQKDFPDFQPCFEKDDSGGSKSQINKPKSQKGTDNKGSLLCCDKIKAQAPSKSSKSDSASSFIPVVLCPDKKTGTDKFKSGSSVSASSMDKKPEDEYDEPYDPCRKPLCEDIKPKKNHCPDEYKPCKKPRAEPKTPPPPFCHEDAGPKCTRQLITGCESAEELKEREKERRRRACQPVPSANKLDLLPPPSTPPEQKSVMQAHCEALENVKQAASVVLNKVYEVTKETVSLIRTESARHLEKIRASKTECDDVCDEPKPPAKPPPKKDPCATEVSNILGRKNILENLEKLETLDAEDVLHKMVEKMESTISMISEHVDFDAIANILKSDDKNTYDTPTPVPPTKMKHRPSHHSRDEVEVLPIHDNIQANLNAANNMFTAIKSKICSIFSEVTRGPENTENTDDDES